MILFLYGPDTFRLKEKIRELKKDSSDWVEVETFDDFRNSEKSVSLFSESKTVFISSFLEEFLELENSPQKVVFYQEKPDKRTRLFKHLNSVAECSEFIMLEGVELEAWIMGRANISHEASRELGLRVGGDLWRVDKELEKLSAFVNYEKTIDEDDVKLLVAPRIDTNIFETLELLVRGDKKKALELLADHLSSGDDENYLFSMFVYQFRTLLKVATNDLEGLHPFVVKKSRPLLGQYPLKNLKIIFEKLQSFDHQSKLGAFEKPATSFALLFGRL